MCKILLSIKPEHTENIFNGNKLFEFRTICCREKVDKIIIYATSPVKQVVGEAKVLKIIKDSPAKVWEMTSKHAGITKMFYDLYFQDKSKAVAYHLGNITRYQKPLRLSDFGVNFAPQSFVYV